MRASDEGGMMCNGTRLPEAGAGDMDGDVDDGDEGGSSVALVSVEAELAAVAE